ncbi:trigger factor [Actinopolymorpha sp. B9G3]|uniref:trigger factor n=1 Tax=Actinopolymorpha sp. B9G3 TaxID=3158970 RepID=UPI0032D8DB15
MKSAVETLSPTRVRLTVEVPFEELKSSLDNAYREIARQVTIPGFRKGKIPPRIIDQRVGRGLVLEQAVQDAIPRLYVDALQENKVEPLGRPEVDVPEIADGADLKFTAEVDVKPEITLPEYHGLELSVDDAEVTDEDVEEQVNSLRERFGSLTTVERAAGDDDYVTIDLSASKDGEELEDEESSGVSYQIGSGARLEGLDDAVKGLQAGESATFSTQLVAGDHAGEDVEVTVTVTAVKEQQLPDLDDDFAQLASEFDTLDELRADLSDRIERSKRIQQAQAARDGILEKLLGLVDIPLPDAAVATEVESRREAIGQQLGQIGLSEEQYLQSEGQSAEEFGQELDKRARDSMKAEFVLDEVAEKEELSVSEDEVKIAIAQRAQQSGMSPADYFNQVIQANYFQTLVQEVRRGKALALVVDNAVVTDESGRPVELKRLQPDGTLAPEGEDAAEASEDADAAGDAETPTDAAEDSTAGKGEGDAGTGTDGDPEGQPGSGA